MWFKIIISLFSLFPLLLGFLNLNKNSENQKKFIFYIIISTIFEAISFYTNIKSINNLWLFILFLYFEFGFFLFFYNPTLGSKKFFKYISLIVFSILFLNEVLINFKLGGNRAFFFFVIITYFIYQSAHVLIEIFENDELIPTKNYLFWISFARLLYFLIIIFIYIYQNFIPIENRTKLFGNIHFIINGIANIILNLIYGISFLCLKPKK